MKTNKEMTMLNLTCICHVSVCEDVDVPPSLEHVKYPVRTASGDKKGNRPRAPFSPRPTPPRHVPAPSPNVIIEEIIEEPVHGEERHGAGTYTLWIGFVCTFTPTQTCYTRVSEAEINQYYFSFLRPGAQAYRETKGTEEESQSTAGQDPCLSKWWNRSCSWGPFPLSILRLKKQTNRKITISVFCGLQRCRIGLQWPTWSTQHISMCATWWSVRRECCWPNT